MYDDREMDRSLDLSGRYRAVKDGELAFGRSNNKGVPMVLCYFRITEGEHAGKVVAWQKFFATDKLKALILKSLRAMGWEGDDLADAVRQPLDNEVEITVEMEEDDKGREWPRVVFVNAPGGGRLSVQRQMDRDELRRFAAEMRSFVHGVNDSGYRERRDDAPHPADMDDIPF